MNDLEQYGWNARLQAIWQMVSLQSPKLIPARVIADFGTSLRIAIPEILTAELSGKLAHYADRQDVPKVGDWVGVHVTDNNVVIETVLPRTGEIARAAAGNKTVKQVIAGNVDTAFVLLALDNDFNVDRLRRYLYQLSINSISPVIVLNKADKTDDLKYFTDQLSLFDAPIIVTSAKEGRGIDSILELLSEGKTAILLGSSGVGKSTLTNLLLEKVRQNTQETRASDDTGKHTTVHRELFKLSNGALLIDTPGIRELQLWGTEEDLEENFDDITALIAQCKYSSCQHNGEQGCMIQPALDDGSLDPKHYAAYLKMKAELVTLKERSIAKGKADSIRLKKRAVARHDKSQRKRSFDE